MIYADHIKNKNSVGFVVNGNMPFLNLRDAENYCAENDILPNKEHLVYDPEKAREIAFILHPELVRIRKRLANSMSEISETIVRRRREADRLKLERGSSVAADIALLEERIVWLTGSHSALLTEYNAIFNRIEELVRIIRNSFKEE